eukprot:756041-Hanusia_phi.AAC.1
MKEKDRVEAERGKKTKERQHKGLFNFQTTSDHWHQGEIRQVRRIYTWSHTLSPRRAKKGAEGKSLRDEERGEEEEDGEEEDEHERSGKPADAAVADGMASRKL